MVIHLVQTTCSRCQQREDVFVTRNEAEAFAAETEKDNCCRTQIREIQLATSGNI